MIVLDASALLELLLPTAAAEAVQKRVFAPGCTLHAPHLIDIEVAQAIRRQVRIGGVRAEDGRAALASLVDLQLNRYAHDLLLPRIWALRDNVTAYDATYIALAELLDAPLLTRDRRLANAPGHRARIEVA